jgi:hypothetical protein
MLAQVAVQFVESSSKARRKSSSNERRSTQVSSIPAGPGSIDGGVRMAVPQALAVDPGHAGGESRSEGAADGEAGRG